MATSRNAGNRTHFGQCMNEKCDHYKLRTKFEISLRDPFICPDCQKPLREVHRDPTFWEKFGKPIIIAGVVVVLGVGGYFIFTGTSSSTDTTAEPEPVVVQEPQDPATQVAQEPEAVEEETGTDNADAEVATADGTPRQIDDRTIDYGFAEYVGRIKNGQPDGTGQLTFRRRHKILNTNYTAEAGEYVVGQFSNGKITMAKLHQNSGNEVIIQ